MKRKSMLSIDFSNFSAYAEKLDRLGADLKEVIGDAMEEAGDKVQQDTLAALDPSNLPHGGIYSSGETEASVIRDPKVKWSGSVGTLDLGFDKTKPGAGGWLITGTPKMRPDMALQRIYGEKKYEKDINKQIRDQLQREIDRRMGG